MCLFLCGYVRIYALLTEAWTGSVWKGGVRRVTNTSLVDTPDAELVLLTLLQASDGALTGVALDLANLLKFLQPRYKTDIQTSSQYTIKHQKH